MKKCNEVPLSQNMHAFMVCYPNQNLAHKKITYFIFPFLKFVAKRYIHRCPEHRSCHGMSWLMR